MTSVAQDRLNGVRSSLAFKAPALVCASSNITLSGAQTIDGVAVTEGDRVLVTGQTDLTENGLYDADTSSWERSPDCNGTRDLVDGTYINVVSGSNNAGIWECITTGEITVGESDLQFRLSSTVLSAGTPRSYGAGCKLSNNVGDATNDIDIAVGIWRDSTNVVDLTLAGAFTKQLDATWAAGTNAGGRAGGVAISDTTWHVFLVLVGGVVDVMFDSSVTCANGVANNAVTQFRRVGSIIRASASILAFIQDGDAFNFVTEAAETPTTNPGTSAVTHTITHLPLGIRVWAKLNISLQSTNLASGVRISDLSATDSAAAVGNCQVLIGAVAAGNISAAELYVYDNTSAQIRSRLVASDATVTLTITVRGWVDSRGKLL